MEDGPRFVPSDPAHSAAARAVSDQQTLTGRVVHRTDQMEPSFTSTGDITDETVLTDLSVEIETDDDNGPMLHLDRLASCEFHVGDRIAFNFYKL